MWASEVIKFVGLDSAASLGTVVTAGGSTHTKGSYAQLTAATPVRADALLVCLGVATANEFLFDIAIGAASSEQIIIPNLNLAGRSAPRVIAPIRVPISVPAGVRLAARCQSNTASAAVRMSVGLITNGLPGFQRVTDYGTVLASSRGAGVDPGATLNTKGSYTQIVASTSRDHRAIVLGFPNSLNAVRSPSASWLLDLAIGGAGSEQIIIADMPLAADSTASFVHPQHQGPFYTHIPAGTRLAARAQADNNDATDRVFDIIVYGLD